MNGFQHTLHNGSKVKFGQGVCNSFIVERSLIGSRYPVVRGDLAFLDLASEKGCVVIDASDAELIGRHKWSRNSSGYAVAGNPCVVMQRLIMRSNIDWSEIEIDHVNRDKLDNRKCNLRLVNRQTNMRNTPPYKNSLSQYKGVGKRGDKWRSRIYFDGVLHHIGHFDSEIDAAYAYDAEARKHGWPESGLNFPKL